MIFSKCYGNGKRVVIGIHGWSGDHRTFEPLVRWMDPEWQLISVDLPGYGRSPSLRNVHLNEIADAIASLVVQMQCKQVRLVGSCSGAVIAMAATQLLQDRVEKVIALELFAWMPWYFRIFTNSSIGAHAYKLTFSTAFGRSLVNLALTQRRTNHSNLTASFAYQDHNVVLDYLRMLATIPGPDIFSDFNVPVSLVVGQHSFRAVKNSALRWREVLPRAIIHEIEDAGHLLIDDAPQRVAQIVFSTHGV